MKFTQALKGYQNERAEGWVQRHQIFNVGQEHKPGLKTITESRARDLVNIGLHRWWGETEALEAPDPNDPVTTRAQAKADLEAKALPTAPAKTSTRAKMTAQPHKKKVAPARQTKVDPPPQRKQPANPPAPAKVRDKGRQKKTKAQITESQPQTTSPDGGQTGAQPDSSSSSQEDQVAAQSTSKRRGIRRGEPAYKARQQRQSAGSQSTTPTDLSPGPTPSTEPTGLGGATTRGSRSSKD